MSLKLKNLALILGLALLSSHVFANDLTLVGTVKQAITLTHPNTSLQAQPDIKFVTLPEYQLSEEVQHLIYQHAQEALKPKTSHILSSQQLKKKQLGMKNVPVLDQGEHGTCATFAVTAAADALINQGDHISQLCLLQLGNDFQAQGLGKSGWDGLVIYDALDRLTHYGFITSKNQKKHGCGDVKNYPYWEKNTPHSSMSLEDYSKRREASSETRFQWEKTFVNFSTDRTNEIKASLNAGHRVIISVLLPRTDLGTVGATAWHHYFNDTWVITYDMAQDLRYRTRLPSHALVITGYDDNAVAMDAYGHHHHGLFTLRNSWGPYVADWGDFYMSYDYADTLTFRGEQLFDTPE